LTMFTVTLFSPTLVFIVKLTLFEGALIRATLLLLFRARVA